MLLRRLLFIGPGWTRRSKWNRLTITWRWKYILNIQLRPLMTITISRKTMIVLIYWDWNFLRLNKHSQLSTCNKLAVFFYFRTRSASAPVLCITGNVDGTKPDVNVNSYDDKFLPDQLMVVKTDLLRLRLFITRINYFPL